MRIDARDVTVRFGATTALDALTVTLSGEKIYGLLGRNGAGKTTLLSVLASFRRVSAGELRISGADPYENPSITGDTCLIWDRLHAQPSDRVSAVLDVARALRPTWDQQYAQELVELFELPQRRRVSELSRGQTSAVGIVLGLATRAPLTLLDESYLGLDAPSRYAFYDALLRDYLAHPRTFIISTHLIEEVGSLFEEVLILDQGRLLMHEQTDTLRSRGAEVTGAPAAVDRFADGLTVLRERRLGPTKTATVFGHLGPERAVAARSLGVELGPLALQDLFIHLTRPSDSGPSDSGPSDSGPSDSGPSDSGPSDSGPKEVRA